MVVSGLVTGLLFPKRLPSPTSIGLPGLAGILIRCLGREDLFEKPSEPKTKKEEEEKWLLPT
jgi:hypothetical protein